ncbi:MAG: phytanoyl-CoA dioxygenase family protein [Gemmatimonadales bacterium]
MNSLADFAKQVDASGFAIVPAVLEQDDLARLERLLPQSSGDSGGLRNLLDIGGIAELAASDPIRSLVDAIVGRDAFPVRGILFDKTPAANWKVSWHQDLTIAVGQRRDAPAYGPWSEKAGVVHVQPPVAVLERMLAVRLHLDESGTGNGPLRVLPGSHRAGALRDADILLWRSRVVEQLCLVPRGGVLLMRPLLLHASSPAVEPHHRRVVHLEYASCGLAPGLEWRWGQRGARAAENVA